MRTKVFHFAPPLILLAALGGCRYTEPNPEHCANNDGDATCMERHGEARAYCEWGDGQCRSGEAAVQGCIVERPTDECYSPCGGRMRFEEDASCLEDAASSSSGGEESSTGEESTGTTTEEMTGTTTTGPMPCTNDEECMDEAAPFCGGEGECVGCDAVGDGACAELDAMAPLCVETQCVSCTGEDSSVCDAQLLLCDEETNACAPCTEHGQCESGACELGTGTCFDPINVLDVGMDQTYTSITAALNEVDAMGLDAAVLRLHGGTDFNETATIESGRVAFVAANAQGPQWINSASMSPTLTVNGADTRVYVEGIRLSGNLNDVGLVVDAATVDIRRSRVVQNSGGGMVANNGATLNVQNCFVGGSIDDVASVTIDSASASILYSTLGAGTTSATALSCSSPTSVVVRNSVLVARGIEATGGFDTLCDDADISYTATETMTRGEGNTTLGEMAIDMPQAWFADFGAGDFHLTTPPIAIATTAQWQDGDPATDIDGDARPQLNGTSDIAGADVP